MNSYGLALAGLGRPAGSLGQLVYFAGLALIGSAIVALAAQVQIPFYPVPQTLQTLAVLGLGAAYGSRLGAATLLLYALEGAVGLPVFAGGTAGPAILFGPTGGYILGFILAAGFVGYFAERGYDRHVISLLAVMLIGAVIVYIPGLIWLSTFTGGLEKAIAVGLAPFIYGDLLKTALAALGLPAAWYLIGRR